MITKDILFPYLEKYGDMPNLTLAKIIKKEKPMIGDIENIRKRIMQYRGCNGKHNLKNLKDIRFLPKSKLIEKFNLPESIMNEYVPYNITYAHKKILIMSDLHIPFQDNKALEVIFRYCKKEDIDGIILNGDIMDCFDISKFTHEPKVSDIKDEVEKCKQLIDELHRVFKGAVIYYKFGNHENRFPDFLATACPELFDIFRLEILLDLYNKKVKYIESDRYITIKGLSIIHGHEYKGSATSAANPARTLFLRTKSSCLGSHGHQTSEHTESNIRGKSMACWTIGCLSDLHPKWLPLNKWNLGFAIYESTDDNGYIIHNKRIIDYRVV